MKQTIKVIYTLFLMSLTAIYIVLIWNLTFGHLFEEIQKPKKIAAEIEQIKKNVANNEMGDFNEVVLGENKRVKHYLGYRVLDERHIEGHFHHIDLDIKEDQQSYCLQCHGDMPHDEIVELRAFWNMHAFFVSCQTCHMRPPDDVPFQFKWYDRTSGDIVDSPVKDGKAGSYNAKIIPFEKVGGEYVRVDSQEKIDFVKDFLEAEPTLNEMQKSKATKIIHKNITKDPVVCEDCHQIENPLLSLPDLGYSKERIAILEHNEVVGMIKKYSKFHFPQFMNSSTDEAADQ